MTAPLIEFGSPAAGTAGSAVPPKRVKVPPPPPRAERSPVSVNGVTISLEAISAEAQQHPASSPGEALRQAAKALVVRELLLAEARASGLSPESAPDDKGRRESDEDALIRALLEQQISTPVADDAACRRYYNGHRSRFTTGSIYEARHILLAAPVEDKAARSRAKETAQQLIDGLTASPSRFADLARDHSACPSREQGGNLGQLTAGSTVPEFETMLGQLVEGQLCPVPVPTRFGFHVIQLDRVIAGKQLPFEVVRDRIAVYLEASSWSRAVSQFIGILAERAEILGIELAPANGAANASPLLRP